MYPVFLDVSAKPCLVIGGGKVARRKIRALLKAGAAVAVVAPALHPGIAALAKKGKIAVFKRKFSARDLDGAFLAFCAAGDEALNARAAAEAAKRGVPVNVADRPALCGFILPSVFRRGELTIAVSTGGASPALAKKIRRDLGKLYGGLGAGELAAVKKLRLKMLASGLQKDRKAYYSAVSKAAGVTLAKARRTASGGSASGGVKYAGNSLSGGSRPRRRRPADR